VRDALGAFQSAVLVGGTSDIGLAVVGRLAGTRARRVVLAGRDEERLRAAGARLGLPVETRALDVRDHAGHGAWTRELFAAGDLDLAIVAAGILGHEHEGVRTSAEAVEILETNTVGCGALLLEIAEAMRAQGHGTIVVLSSVAGERARKANFVYGASKAGLDALAQGLADDLAGTGVRLLVVRPGFVRTTMTEGMDAAPLATTPEAVAEAVERGLRGGAHTVWAPGPLRAVMAVMRHLPRPLWRRVPR
jgi:decaprenylphospho-beta-D-erythro-pentofuranosid-2-ulose 2-reductase